MKPWLIWIFAIAICAVPVGWLARRNVRAVPIGALVVAFVVVGYVGALGIAGGGYNPETRPAEAAKTLGITLAVMAALAIVNLVLLTGSVLERVSWTGASTLVWGLVGTVLYGAFLQVQQVGRDAANEAFLAPRRLLEQEIVGRRAELDRLPELRRAVLNTATVTLQAEVARRYEKLERVLVFGDPVSAPGDVVVWGVLTMRPDSPWEKWGFDARELHGQMNEQLRQGGYPARIALGFAPTAAVDGAGGDQAYFGKDGATMVPQYPPDSQMGTGTGPRTLEPPQRRR